MTTLQNLLLTQQTKLNKYFVDMNRHFENVVNTMHDSSTILIDAIKTTSTTHHRVSSAIYFTGIGKNDTIAKKSANMLRSLNFNAHHISPVDAMHGDMGLLNDGDIIVAISKSGSTSELIHFLQYVRQFKNLNIFGIQMGTQSSRFDDYCHEVIKLPEVDELDSFNLVPTTSNITAQLYVDLIAISTMDELSFSKDDFVKSHPGGSIGQSK